MNDQWLHDLHQRFLQLRQLPVRENVLSLYVLEEGLRSGSNDPDTDECNGMAECDYYGSEDNANEKLIDSVVESATNQKAYEAPSYCQARRHKKKKKKKIKTKNQKKNKKKIKANMESECQKRIEKRVR